MNKLIARGTMHYKHDAYTRSVDVHYDDSHHPSQAYNVQTISRRRRLSSREELARFPSLAQALTFAKRHIRYHLRSTHWLLKTSPLEQLAAAMDDTQIIDLCDPDAEIPEWVYKLHTSP